MPTTHKTYKSRVIEQASIYRTSPYQYINTATNVNTVQTVGKISDNNIQTTIIKPEVVSTKVE
jgi:hypothetical protein